MVHPRLAINSLSTATWPIGRDLELYAELGVHTISLYYDKVEAGGVDAVKASGLDVMSVFTRGVTLCQPELWDGEQKRLLEAVAVGAELGAPLLPLTTGNIGTMTWDEGVDTLQRALEPVIAATGDVGMRVGIESTLPVRVEIGFIHSYRDIVEVARRLGLAAVFEANYSFNERG